MDSSPFLNSMGNPQRTQADFLGPSNSCYYSQGVVTVPEMPYFKRVWHVLPRLFVTVLLLCLHGFPEAYSVLVHPKAEDSNALWQTEHNANDFMKRGGSNTTKPTEPKPLPPHHWELAKTADDVEPFRQKHNLTLVRAPPQDAAMMPSWPQALVQLLLVAPPIEYTWTKPLGDSVIEYSTRTELVERTITYHASGVTHERARYREYTTATPIYEAPNTEIGLFDVVQAVLSPFLFVAWTTSFSLAHAHPDGSGWLSVLGWAAWYNFMHLNTFRANGWRDVNRTVNRLALLPMSFQWAASLCAIVQRWKGKLGSVAYRVEDLNGCKPVDGLSYLQQGRRTHSFKVIQSVTFPVATVSLVLSMGKPRNLNLFLAVPALAELIYCRCCE